VSDNNPNDNYSGVVAAVVTVVVAVIIIYIAKVFLSFLIRNWGWTLLIVLSAIAAGLYVLFRPQKGA